ncbi:hypothetical protein CMEL01_16792 [Colletotrichum melonis]|uniref:Uncharacterized protein n=2 Tax=Colletotrichum acutatum species complex TaxID=2707335 RepID=A0AAI9U317_9PEZI|nr:hypothetical protein CMEL01_16792 [Colletotrichum melonis]
MGTYVDTPLRDQFMSEPPSGSELCHVSSSLERWKQAVELQKDLYAGFEKGPKAWDEATLRLLSEYVKQRRIRYKGPMDPHAVIYGLAINKVCFPSGDLEGFVKLSDRLLRRRLALCHHLDHDVFFPTLLIVPTAALMSLGAATEWGGHEALEAWAPRLRMTFFVGSPDLEQWAAEKLIPQARPDKSKPTQDIIGYGECRDGGFSGIADFVGSLGTADPVTGRRLIVVSSDHYQVGKADIEPLSLTLDDYNVYEPYDASCEI